MTKYYTEEQVDKALEDLARYTIRWVLAGTLFGVGLGEATMYVFLWAIDKLK